MRKLLVLAASTAVVAASFAAYAAAQPDHHKAAPAAAHPQIGAFGFDLAGMDRSVAPGDSFYRYANGNWDRTTEIPADRANYGMFTALDDLSRQRTRAILDEAMRTPGSRIGDFYASFMDEAAVDAAGMAPLRPMIARLQAIADRSGWAAESGRMFREGVTAPFNGFVGSDDRIPTEMIMRLTQSGLGLPDRDYYLRDDPNLVEKRTAYQAYMAQLLTLAGESGGAERAAAVLAFERRLAEVQWTRIENRDDERTYNKWAMADFARNAPGFDWARYFETTGLSDQQNILVSQPTAFTGTARIVSETPLPVLKDYMLLRLVDNAAPYLSRPFVEANFAFHGTVLNGTPQNEDRWKRGVTLVTAVDPRRRQPHLCRSLFPTRGQGGGGRAGPQRHRRHGPPPRGPRLDGAGNAGAGAGQARRLHPQDRLPRQLARLFERGGQPYQPPPEHHQRDRVRISAQFEQARPPGRSLRVGDDSDDGERLRQSGVERDRLPGRDPAAALLRSERRSGGQLWRHRRGHRPRDQPSFRRSGQPLRRAWRAPRMVDAAGPRTLQCADRAARRRI